jgi:uncharacterized membrane protein
MQAVGQLIWCVAHTAWVGSSFMVWMSLALCAHHALGVAHGDYRLRCKHGAAFDAVRSSTLPNSAACVTSSVWPTPHDAMRSRHVCSHGPQSHR